MATATESTEHTTYGVNLWQSDPSEGNDDCSTGLDYETLAEAQGAFEALAAGNVPAHLGDDVVENEERYNRRYEHIARSLANCSHVELCRGVREYGKPDAVTISVAETPHAAKVAARLKRQQERDRGAWRHEQAMEAGMLHGVDAYNDAMGY